MHGFIMYITLVGIIILACVVWIIAFGIVANEIHKLRMIVRGKRKDKKIFKTAERCRDDFA